MEEEPSAISAGATYMEEKADDEEEDFLLTSPPNLVCHTLSPSLMSVALLGHLLLLTPKKDFALGSSGQKTEHIKYPESFRACLLQICQEAYKAFNLADKNMGMIGMLSGQIIHQLHELKENIRGYNDIQINNFVPLTLMKVERKVTSCKNLAEETESCFGSVENLVAEVQNVSQTAQTLTNDKFEDVQKKMKTYIRKKEVVERRFEETKTQLEEQKLKVTRIEQRYLEKMRESSTWSNTIIEAICMLFGKEYQWASTGDISSEHRFIQRLRMATMFLFSKGELRLLMNELDKNMRVQKEYTERFIKQNEDMEQLLDEFEKLDAEKLELKDILQMLERGIESLCSVKEQWARMVGFFQKVSELMKGKVHSRFKDLKLTTDVVLGSNLMDKDKKLAIVKDIALSLAAADQLSLVSSVYLDVSNNYLMENVLKLGGMITLVNKGDQQAIKKAKSELNRKCRFAIEKLSQTFQTHPELQEALEFTSGDPSGDP